MKNDKKVKNDKKKTYQKPQIKSQKILEAGLGAVCNGSQTGGRKGINPCTTLKT